jgi:DNA-binding MarR family transcriptional regulator
MTEELMSYLQENPDYFYIIRNKQLIAILRFLCTGGRTMEEIAKEFKLQPKILKPTLEDLVKKKVITTMNVDNETVYVLEFNGQRVLDLLGKAKQG